MVQDSQPGGAFQHGGGVSQNAERGARAPRTAPAMPAVTADGPTRGAELRVCVGALSFSGGSPKCTQTPCFSEHFGVGPKHPVWTRLHRAVGFCKVIASLLPQNAPFVAVGWAAPPFRESVRAGLPQGAQ